MTLKDFEKIVDVNNRHHDASTEYIAQLVRHIAFLEARIEELMKGQPLAPIYLEVSPELRGVPIEHLKQMGVKTE